MNSSSKRSRSVTLAKAVRRCSTPLRGSKGRRRRHQIIGGYASDRRIDAVLYLVADMRIAREVQNAARRFGFDRRVLVQRALIGPGQAPETRAAADRRADRSAAYRPAIHGAAADPRRADHSNVSRAPGLAL